MEYNLKAALEKHYDLILSCGGSITSRPEGMEYGEYKLIRAYLNKKRKTYLRGRPDKIRAKK